MEQLSHKLWDEWISFSALNPVEDEIAGILEGLVYKEANGECRFLCRRLFTVRRLLRLWSESEFQKTDAIRLIHAQPQKASIGFSIDAKLTDEILARMSGSGRMSRNWNWVRGLCGSCGSLYLPKAGYHFVIRPPLKNRTADRMQSILKSSGFAVGVRKKGSSRELMLRDQQQIVTFLSRLGFVQITLALEETAIYRSMRSHANKLVNCDAANINKSLEAARSQMQMITKFEEFGIVEELPEPLRELIYARKRSPSISLKELGQTLARPISKSTVEYRWRKCENILYKLLKGDGGHVLGKG